MKLAFCLYKYFPYGGLERNFLRISQLCAERGHSIDVYTMDWKGPKPDNYNITIIPVNSWSNHGKTKSFAKKLNAILKQQNYDVVIGFNRMPGLDLYYSADPCYVDKINHLKPAIYKLSNRYRHFSAFEKAVFDPSSKTQLMMLSEIEQKKYISHYHTQKDRFHFLPPGISADRKRPADADTIREQWRSEFNIHDDEKVILMIGSAFKRKGLERTLLGVASLPEELKSKTHIMMIGEDNPKPFQALAEKLGITKQLHIFLGRDDVPRFLLGADLLAHPAISENTGNVILEAIVAGLPVLISGACGYAFHVERSKSGLIAKEPFSQADFDQKLEIMLTSPEHSTWVENCIKYSLTEDLYSRPEAAADIIDSFAKIHDSE
ncbi:MAG: glycosyltransferase [Methylomarinum sp.]|nr:glycosyltransferase [Methylomarinum sp.]